MLSSDKSVCIEMFIVFLSTDLTIMPLSFKG